jgi:hypothetical protein
LTTVRKQQTKMTISIKPKFHLVSVITVVVLLILSVVYGSSSSPISKLYNKIYTHVQIDFPCPLYLHDSQPYGCSGTINAGTALLAMNHTSEIVNVCNKKDKKYVLVIPVYELHNLAEVKDSIQHCIAGVLLSQFMTSSDDNPPQFWSNAPTNPNSEYSFYGRDYFHIWNSVGTNLTRTYFPFPILQINGDQDKAIVNMALFNYRKLIIENGKDDRLYHAEWNYAMELDSQNPLNIQSCFNDHSCQPVGEQSIYTLLRTKNSNNSDIVILSTMLDTSGIFLGLTPGGTFSSSILTQLAIANILAERFNFSVPGVMKRDMLFTFFGAENYGYSGSSRFLSDVQQFSCSSYSKDRRWCQEPYMKSLKFQDILSNGRRFSHVIEIGPISHGTDLYFHGMNDSSFWNQQLSNDVQQSSMFGKSVPLSSLHSFGPHVSTTRSLLVSINDFDSDMSLSHPYLYSQFDFLNVNTTLLSKLVCQLVPVLSKLVTDTEYNPSSDQCHQAVQQQLTNWKQLNLENTPKYAGVYNFGNNIKKHVKYVSYEMNRLFPDMTVEYHRALSPRFEYDYDNMQWQYNGNVSGSAFVESDWSELKIRIFQVVSQSEDIAVMISGITITLVSYAIGIIGWFFCLRKHKDKTV